MQIRKICIKSIAVLMTATVMVSTPLSRFADTRGVSETHAAGVGTVITLTKLFGAIASAYGLYVGLDKLAEHVSEWEIWTSTNNSEAHTALQTIKNGVTSYVITKAVTNSVADFLASKVSDDYSYTLQGVADMHENLEQSRLENVYYKDFIYLLENEGLPFSEEQIPLFYKWNTIDNSAYLDGKYEVWTFLKEDVNTVLNTEGVVTVIYYSIKNSDGSMKLYCSGFDSAGNYVTHTDKLAYNSIALKSSGWVRESGGSASSTRTISSKVFNYQHAYAIPFYETTFPTFSTVRTLEEIKTNSYATKSITVDYKTHGNNALDNVDALAGSEVSEETLTHLYDVSSEAYQNYLKSQQDNNDDNNNDINYAPLASAITAAVIASLKDMGYIENPSDEPSGEDVKQQLGNIQISLDGLIDAISQINPAQGLANIAQGIAELPQKITASVTDAIRNVFEDLFVPDEGAIQNKVDEITDKFAFADSLLTVVDDIDGALKNASGPPEIYIHFEDAEDSKYTPIGTLKLLSFEWYERYKPYGDALLSSMLWLFFLWKVRKRIAEIVQGLSVSGESDANASANSAIGIERGRSS